jgi:tetratricopeptide (TPR) repeat protein
MIRIVFAAVAVVICAACASTPTLPPDSEQYLPPDVEAISLLGKPLASPPLAPEVEKKREEELAQAQRDYDANRESAEAIIWLGRRTAYLGRYREAIDIFTEGIRKHPDDARLYRHRGHRYITIRRFQNAVRDLQFASLLVRGKPDEVEPDGQPNARNIPTGSLQSNIFYHLGLAYYLQGDFDHALHAYERCLALANNPDRLVSTSHWMYMTLRRLGRVQEAEKLLQPIGIDLDVIETYHKLLLMYGGEIAPEELVRSDPNTTEGATILYGIGNWYFYNGQPEKAYPLWQKIIDGSQWPAFGYVAAEAEVARRGSG